MSLGRSGSVVAVVVLAALAPARASEVRSFRMHSLSDFLAGTLEGIGVDALGTLQLSDRVERLSEVGEPFVFTASAHPDGWVLGTGNSGKVLPGRDWSPCRKTATSSAPNRRLKLCIQFRASTKAGSLAVAPRSSS